VAKALKEYLVSGKRIEEYIKESKNLIDFQIPVKIISRNYVKLVLGKRVSKDKIIELETLQSHNRGFITKDANAGIPYKLKYNKREAKVYEEEDEVEIVDGMPIR
jgi:hypothetical protein